ncbi:hypothetical protein GCM10009534_63590 [Kribbella sandramycini]
MDGVFGSTGPRAGRAAAVPAVTIGTTRAPASTTAVLRSLLTLILLDPGGVAGKLQRMPDPRRMTRYYSYDKGIP